MRLFATMLAFASIMTGSAGAQKIDPKENPEAYWNRGYGCSPSAENYNVTIRVNDVDGMASRIDVMMMAAGAPSQIGSNNSYYSGNQPRGRQMNYSVPAKAAEKQAKKLMDMGELINYSLNRPNSGDSQKQIEERIAILEEELANKAALEKMPAARYFLTSRLAGLKQNREICVAGASRSNISISLQGRPAESKP